MARASLKEVALPLITVLENPSQLEGKLNFLKEASSSTLQDVKDAVMFSQIRNLSRAKGRRFDTELEGMGKLQIRRTGFWFSGRGAEIRLIGNDGQTKLSAKYGTDYESREARLRMNIGNEGLLGNGTKVSIDQPFSRRRQATALIWNIARGSSDLEKNKTRTVFEDNGKILTITSTEFVAQKNK